MSARGKVRGALRILCSWCHGQGRWVAIVGRLRRTCRRCNGSGTEPAPRILPAGLRPIDTVRVVAPPPSRLP